MADGQPCRPSSSTGAQVSTPSLAAKSVKVAIDSGLPQSNFLHVQGVKMGPISYASIVKGKVEGPQKLIVQNQRVLQSDQFPDPSTIELSSSTIDDNGNHTIAFTKEEQHQMVNKLKWVLIGKFSHGKPSLKLIRAFFQDLQLEGSINLAFLDHKHLFIECSCYKDYYMIWLQIVWYIHGFHMRMFKWLPTFSNKVESPIAPVWIRIFGLAPYMFDESTLLSVASSIGTPIKVDRRNVNHSLLSFARICIELDVSKPLIDSITINIVDEESGVIIESRSAKVIYDVLPHFCTLCSHIGHRPKDCKRDGLKGIKETAGLLHPSKSVVWQGSSHKVWKQVGPKPKETQTSQEELASLKGKGKLIEEPIGPQQKLHLADENCVESSSIVVLSAADLARGNQAGQIVKSAINSPCVQLNEEWTLVSRKKNKGAKHPISKTQNLSTLNEDAGNHAQLETVQVALTTAETSQQIGICSPDASRGDVAPLVGVNNRIASMDGSSKAIVIWKGENEEERIEADAQEMRLITDVIPTENEAVLNYQDAPESQLITTAMTQAHGVITRAQANASNNKWADLVEEEQNATSPAEEQNDVQGNSKTDLNAEAPPFSPSKIQDVATHIHERQVVNKNNKTQGVVTRSQAKILNNSWADKDHPDEFDSENNVKNKSKTGHIFKKPQDVNVAALSKAQTSNYISKCNKKARNRLQTWSNREYDSSDWTEADSDDGCNSVYEDMDSSALSYYHEDARGYKPSTYSYRRKSLKVGFR